MARDKSSKPEKQRWFRQIQLAFNIARETDPTVTWWVLGAVLGVLALGLGIGALLGNWILALFFAIPMAALAGMFVLTRKAEAAAYNRIAGTPGATRAALGTVTRSGWEFEDEPVAFNQKTGDLVFRGVGRGGVVLVGEGPPNRVQRLLDSEEKRVTRLVPNVPVTKIQMGEDEGQVALTKVSREVVKIKPTLTKQEAAEVNKRLKALGGKKLPIPKGVDPMRARPNRKAMRGR